jgi:endoglucanase
MFMAPCPFDTQVWAVGDNGHVSHLESAGMTWVNDLAPIPNHLFGIFAASATEIWACGQDGVMLNSNGDRWSTWPVPVVPTLRAMAGIGRDHVWACGDETTMLFFDGSTWKHLPVVQPLGSNGPVSFRGVSVYPGDDFLGKPKFGVAVGDHGVVYTTTSSSGSSWQEDWSQARQFATNRTLRAVTTCSHTESWAVGEAGTLIMWDGVNWVSVYTGTEANLNAVDSFQSGNVIAVGDDGVVVYSHWQHVMKIAPTPSTTNLYAVSNLAAGTFFGHERVGLGNGGGHAMMLSPDSWHSSSMRLYCGSHYRRNLDPYDAIEFYFKAISEAAIYPTFKLGKWNRDSHTLSIRDYIEGGVIDGTWRLVHIPLPDLRTEDWALGSTSTLTWMNVSSCAFGFTGSYTNCAHMLVDDVRVLDLTPPHIVNMTLESSTVIRLRLNEPYDPVEIKDKSLYSLVSDEDPAYAQAQSPTAIGMYFHFDGFSAGARTAVNGYEVFARFEHQFRNGLRYHFTTAGIIDESKNRMLPSSRPFVFDDRTMRNPNIKVAAGIGFLPESEKIAVVGGYLGDLGGLVWAVGSNGSAYSWDYGRWVQHSTPATSELRAVAALREDEATAVGDDGTIISWRNGRWGWVACPVQSNLNAISMGRNGRAWAVGDHGVILRYVATNRSWSVVDSGTTENLRGVWVGPPTVGSAGIPRKDEGWEDQDWVNLDLAYVVGDNGTMLLFDPMTERWKPLAVPTRANLRAVTELAAVGDGGTVLSFYWDAWHLVSHRSSGVSDQDLTAIFVSSDATHWAGSSQGIFKGDPSALWSPSKVGKASWEKPSWAASHALGARGGTITSIARVSTKFCGFKPARKNCVYALAASSGGQVFKWDGSGWTAMELPGAPPSGINGMASVVAGALRLPSPLPEATIRDASTAEVLFTAPVRLVAANWRLSGEDVHRINFTTFRPPANSSGRFVVHVPGIGLSDNFAVSDRALDFAAYTTGRGLFYQRCGFAGGLQAPFATPRHARPACHEHNSSDSAASVDAVFAHDLVDSPLYNGEPVDGTTSVDTHGGWHDAGDYNKYIMTAALALKVLVDGYDIDPAAWQDDMWNLPESGVDGLPDLLSEMAWEVEWMLRVQDSDGGVYHKCSSCNWFFGMPHEEKSPRLINPKSTHDTGFFAASVAASARVFRDHNATQAARYQERAELAWAFLMEHPGNDAGEGVPRGGYGNPPGCHTGAYQDHYDYDNRLWAAAELFRLTGNSTYAAFFESWYRGAGPRVLASNSGAGRSRVPFAMWAYMLAAEDGMAVRPAIAAKVKTNFLRGAKATLKRQRAQPYLNGDRLDVPGWIGWGKFTYGSEVAITLLKAWKLSGDEQYRRAAHTALGPQYGANPLSMSFVTGLGDRYPRNPTCEVCLADGVPDPYPGIPVFGVFAHLSNGHPFYVITQNDANNFPYVSDTADDKPVLRRYVDHKQMIPMSEYTINTMAHTLVAVNLLAKQRTGARLAIAAAVVSADGAAVGVQLSRRFEALARTHGGGDCGLLFAPETVSALGTGARCVFAANATELVISLGEGSAVSAGGGTVLRTRRPDTGFDNYETREFSESMVVQAPPPMRRRLAEDQTQAAAAADADAFAAASGAAAVLPADGGVMIASRTSGNASTAAAAAKGLGSPAMLVFDLMADSAERASGSRVDYTTGGSGFGTESGPGSGSGSGPGAGAGGAEEDSACPGGCGRGACVFGGCACVEGYAGGSCEAQTAGPTANATTAAPTANCCACSSGGASCTDLAAGWHNGAGLTCAQYAQEGFCTAGSVLVGWATGAVWRFPELQCCVCGGGSTGAGRVSGCADTAGWVNGAGADCLTYQHEQFCSGGKVLEGWTGGEVFNSPEVHCCVCGGGDLKSGRRLPEETAQKPARRMLLEQAAPAVDA